MQPCDAVKIDVIKCSARGILQESAWTHVIQEKLRVALVRRISDILPKNAPMRRAW